MSVTWRVKKDQLEPGFAAAVDALLAEDPGEWYVTYGFRTRDEQEALYKKYLAGGPRAALPGKSAHEFGLAVDVALVTHRDGKAKTEWNSQHPDWLRLINKVRLHPILHSLYKIGDFDHIERVAWKSFKNWKSA